MMLEKEIEKRVQDYARGKEIAGYKFTSPARAAVPDRLFVYQGHVFFIEFKKTGKKPTPAQVREITRLRNAGVATFVVDTVEEGKCIMDQVSIGINPVLINGSGVDVRLPL